MSNPVIQYIFTPELADDVEIAKLLIDLSKVIPLDINGSVIGGSTANLEVYLPIAYMQTELCQKLILAKDAEVLEFRNILAAFTVMAQQPGQKNFIEVCRGRLIVTYKKVNDLDCIKLEYFGNPITGQQIRPLSDRVKEVGRRKPERFKDGSTVITPLVQPPIPVAIIRLDTSKLTIELRRGVDNIFPDTFDCVTAAYPLENMEDVRVIRTKFEREYLTGGIFRGLYRIISNDPISETDIDVNKIFY